MDKFDGAFGIQDNKVCLALKQAGVSQVTGDNRRATFRVVSMVPGKSVNSHEVKLVTEVAVEPPAIAIAKSGAGISIAYTGKLQSSATVNGNYQDVADALSPYTVPNFAGAQFFRSIK